MTEPLPYVGFKPLRPGRIHLYCPACGRKYSNMQRQEYDPPKAVIYRIGCPECSAGCKDEDGSYLDAEGRELDFETGEPYR